VLDLETCAVGSVAGACWPSLTKSGEWRRFGHTWRPLARAPMTVNIHYEGTDAAALTRPVLEAAAAPTTYGAALRAHDALAIVGPLAAELQRESFTLVIETRGLTAAPVALPFLSAGDNLLLGRSSNGGLRCGFASAETASVPYAAWSGRRRSLLSISRENQRGVIATGGSAAVAFQLGKNPFQSPFSLGAHASSFLNGFVTRLAVFPAAADIADVTRLVD
jgi:hypothetical protein